MPISQFSTLALTASSPYHYNQNISISIVVNQDTLAALDALQWLRTGAESSMRLGISAPMISRYSKKCLDLFGLELQRINGEWHTVGDMTTLLMERHVHQTARWLGYRPLRLEATYWSGPLLCTPPPACWILGLCNIVGTPRSFQLVRERIIDACITGLPDIPPADDPDLTSYSLSSMPVFFVAPRGHPLIGKPDLTYSDIAMYPSLGLPDGSYPKVEESLKSIGLWNDVVRMTRYRREMWEGRSEAELTIGFGTCLSMAISGESQARLPLELPFQSGEAIMIRREFALNPELFILRALLLERFGALALDNPELTLTNADR